MATITSKTPAPQSSLSLPSREIALVGLAAVALYLFLAIGSHSPEDASFSYTGSSGATQNLMGTSGAYLADLFLFLLGWVAYLVPVGLVVVGVRMVLSRELGLSWVLLSIRASGWIALFVCIAMLLHLHSAPAEGLPAGTGGVLGQWLVAQGGSVFGLIGLTLVAVAGALIGAQAAAGFSWLDVAEVTGRQVYRCAAIAVNLYDGWRDRHAVKSNEAASRDQLVQKRQQALEKQRAKDSARERKAEPRLQILPQASERKAPTKAQQKRLFDTQSITELPDVDLLDQPVIDDDLGYSAESLEAMSRQLELKLLDFGVEAEVVSVLPGPVVTRFELQPAAGVKVQKISSLAKDLARSLAVISVRIVEVIPGKSVVGIEIPNEHREMVRLKEVIESPAFQDAPSPLTLALGKDIAGAVRGHRHWQDAPPVDCGNDRLR